MKKVILTYALFIFASFVLVGCKKETSSNTCDPMNLKFATWASTDELREFNEIIDRVNEMGKNDYHITVKNYVSSNYYTKLKLDVTGKKTPDLFWLSQEHIDYYANKEAIANLDSFFSNSQSLQKDKFYDNVLYSTEYEGSNFGVPFIANPVILYVNEDLFKENNLEVPTVDTDWTWDDIIDVATQLTSSGSEEEKTYGLAMSGFPPVEYFMWAGGGEYIDQDGNLLIDSEDSMKGLDILNKLMKSGSVPSYKYISSVGGPEYLFTIGRAAMFFGGIQDNFEQKVAEEGSGFTVSYAQVPINLDGTRSTFNWTASTVVKKGCVGNEKVYQALENLSNEFYNWKIASPLKGDIDKIVEVNPDKEKALPIIKEALTYARSTNYTVDFAEINHNVWYDVYQKMLRDPSFDYRKAVKEVANRFKK